MKPIKKVLGCLRKADNDYGMIQDGDRIAVGISGGKDSSILLYCLYLYQMFSKKKYEFMGIYIDLGFGQENIPEITEYFARLGIRIETVPSQISEILDINRDKEGRIECSLCSKLRKGALVNAAKQFGCNKVAFGHHSDDAVETLFMNMIHGGRISTFDPNMLLERSGVYLIRPLVYAYEKDIARMARELEMPISKNKCPNEGYTERTAMKFMMEDLYKKYPEARNNFQLMLRNKKQLSIFEPKEESTD